MGTDLRETDNVREVTTPPTLEATVIGAIVVMLKDHVAIAPRASFEVKHVVSFQWNRPPQLNESRN